MLFKPDSKAWSWDWINNGAGILMSKTKLITLFYTVTDHALTRNPFSWKYKHVCYINQNDTTERRNNYHTHTVRL